MKVLKINTLFLTFLLLSLLFVSGKCNTGQININSASIEELDKIKWVGESTAKEIINSRPFSSLDELIEIKYITESRLSEIKTEALACVDEAEIEDLEKNETEENLEKQSVVVDLNEISPINNNQNKEQEIKNNIIILSSSSKDIKTENDSSNQNKNNFALYGLTIFCILLAFLFFFKNRRKDGIE